MRRYEQTHPWITFTYTADRISPLTWMHIGEVVSKCEHLAGVALAPRVAKRLMEVYISKSAHGTTQIEGNTLTENEVLARVRDELELPPSLEYLGQEVDNILVAYKTIIDDLYEGNLQPLTPDRIRHFNRLVLQDLTPNEDVVPGEFRKTSVLVGGGIYRGAPAEDCDYLITRLCEWLESLPKGLPEDFRMPVALLSAMLAHLYLAWIHPFGDGNGRTARLIEFQLLIQAGVPLPAAHLLSDFYNKTRTKYLHELDLTSKTDGYPIEGFLKYGLQGFVDELREQISVVQLHQLHVAWINFIHDTFQGRETTTGARQRNLVLSLPNDKFTPISKIRELTPKLALEYANLTRKAITRDLNVLQELGLIIRSRTSIKPNIEQMWSFMPLRADLDATDVGEKALIKSIVNQSTPLEET